MHLLYSDGGARGNPGAAAAAAILLDEAGGVVWSASKFLGVTTNNMAEYAGLILGLKQAILLNVLHLKCHLDSELVVMQMNGAYRVKEPKLKAEWGSATELAKKFASIQFVHIRRELNKQADLLVNAELDLHATLK